MGWFKNYYWKINKRGSIYMIKEINCWGVLIGFVGVLFCIGVVYVFSVFVGLLSVVYGWIIL